MTFILQTLLTLVFPLFLLQYFSHVSWNRVVLSSKSSSLSKLCKEETVVMTITFAFDVQRKNHYEYTCNCQNLTCVLLCPPQRTSTFSRFRDTVDKRITYNAPCRVLAVPCNQRKGGSFTLGRSHHPIYSIEIVLTEWKAANAWAAAVTYVSSCGRAVIPAVMRMRSASNERN